MFALVLVSFVGVLGTMVLGYGSIGIRSTGSVRAERAAAYAADGAVQGAIQYVRTRATTGRDPATGGTCPTFNLPDVDATPVAVTCTGQPGSGVVSPGLNAPLDAVLTLGTSASEPGVSVVGTGSLRVEGAVFSSSTITVPTAGGKLDATGNVVQARGACDANRITATTMQCDVGAVGDPAGTDPAYASPLKTLPAYHAVPACPGPNSTLTFAPGFYDDAAALSSLMSGGCPGLLAWFQPGTYYFDFDLDPARPAVWSVDDSTVNVVGGTPKGWSPTGRPAVPIPGGCKTEADAAPNAGVTFVFGGGSRFRVGGGKVELCATPSRSAQQLAIYGLRTGATPAQTITAARAATVTQVAATTAFSSRANAKAITTTPSNATAVLAAAAPGVADPTGATPTVAALDLSGYAMPALPGGAASLRVTLRVAHAESTSAGGMVVGRPGRVAWPTGVPIPTPPNPVPAPPGNEPAGVWVPVGAAPAAPPDPTPGGATITAAPGSVVVPAPAGTVTLTATVTPGDGSPSCSVLIPASQSSQVAEGDVTPCVDTPAKRAGLTVRFSTSAVANVPVTEKLDGVELAFHYTPPALRAQTGCVALAGPGGCPFVSDVGGAPLVVQGTVYAPLASLDVDLAHATRVVLARGLVTRALVVRNPSADPNGTIRLLGRRQIAFVAKVDGRRRIRALVSFLDTPVAGQTVTVDEWSAAR